MFQNGWTALHWATDRNHQEVIKLLLSSGIDATLKGRVCNTTLAWLLKIHTAQKSQYPPDNHHASHF